MFIRRKLPMLKILFKGNYFFLLMALILLSLIFPFIDSREIDPSIVDIFFAMVLLSGIRAVAKKRSQFIIGLALALISFGASIYNFILPNGSPSAFWCTLFVMTTDIIFLFYTGKIIIMDVLTGVRVTRNAIIGAICVYFLIGIIFTNIYLMIEMVHPESFSFCKNNSGENPVVDYNMPRYSEMLYFSFTTITTLGYGDIYPQTTASRIFCSFEAILGQIYVAVLIAHLVGLYAMYRSRRE